MSERRVVVTGMGTVNPLGGGVDEFWKNLQEGVSGIDYITAFDTTDYKVKFGGEAPFDVEAYLPRKEYRRLDRFAQLFYAGAKQAMDDAGLSYEEDDPEAWRAGAVGASGIGGIITLQHGLDLMRERGPDRLSPIAITEIIPNMGSGYASIALNLFGPNNTTVTACAASANAIGDAAEIIKRDDADVMLAGGAEAAIIEFAVAGFSQARALSTRNDDPKAASRPFDADRDGFVMSEGSAVLVLEEREHAIARGADIYAEVTGYGMSADGFHVTLPRPGGVGAAKAMERALYHARLEPTQIDYINAHGTSTSANDSTETAAIKLVFGDEAYNVPISSTKSMTGHLLGGAGAIEAIVSVLAIRDGIVPPTINYTTPDPECDLDYVPNEARNLDIKAVMTNSFGFGGHNVALVFQAA